MKKIFIFPRIKSSLVIGTISFFAGVTMVSCDPTIDSLSYDIAEANSKDDQTPPTASFSATETEDYLTYTFANTSTSATDYIWDFGDGNTSTDLDGINTYLAEGSYTVTLIASDKLDVVSTMTTTIEVVEPDAPASIIPEILNGDFDAGQDNWKITSFTGGTTSPFNTSSDGDPLNYDGSDSGASKTAGAKWTSTTAAGPSVSSDTRYAYQAITVSPDTEYIVEFSYAIKTDSDDIDGGDRVIVELLDGWFADGIDAVASSDTGALTQSIGSTADGKGNFEVITKTFTSNASGEIAIWIYAITNDELYVDNVKVYPAE